MIPAAKVLRILALANRLVALALAAVALALAWNAQFEQAIFSILFAIFIQQVDDNRG